MAGELIEPRSEPTIISINGYTIKLSSKYVSLYTQTSSQFPIKEVSLYCGQWLKQKLTIGHNTEIKCLWSHQPQMGHH